MAYNTPILVVFSVCQPEKILSYYRLHSDVYQLVVKHTIKILDLHLYNVEILCL